MRDWRNAACNQSFIMLPTHEEYRPFLLSKMAPFRSLMTLVTSSNCSNFSSLTFDLWIRRKLFYLFILCGSEHDGGCIGRKLGGGQIFESKRVEIRRNWRFIIMTFMIFRLHVIKTDGRKSMWHSYGTWELNTKFWCGKRKDRLGDLGIHVDGRINKVRMKSSGKILQSLASPKIRKFLERQSDYLLYWSIFFVTIFVILPRLCWNITLRYATLAPFKDFPNLLTIHEHFCPSHSVIGLYNLYIWNFVIK